MKNELGKAKKLMKLVLGMNLEEDKRDKRKKFQVLVEVQISINSRKFVESAFSPGADDKHPL